MVALTGMLLKLTGPLPVDVVMVSVLPKMIPLAPAVKTTPDKVPVVIDPLSVMVPVVVTVKEFKAVPVPTAPKVTAPEPERIVRP